MVRQEVAVRSRCRRGNRRLLLVVQVMLQVLAVRGAVQLVRVALRLLRVV